jgi:hypothetical protein
MRLLLPLLLSTACIGTATEPEGRVTIRLDASFPHDPLESDTVTWTLEGDVTALAFEPQAHTWAGFDAPDVGFTLRTDDGDTVSAGLSMARDGAPIDEAFALAVDQRVTITFVRAMPWGVEHALVVDAADGLVAAGVDGQAPRPTVLDDRLIVTEGEAAPSRFRHPCGWGREVRLEFRADDEASVPTNTDAPLTVEGHASTAYNVNTWVNDERAGVACLDWGPPWGWAVFRD